MKVGTMKQHTLLITLLFAILVLSCEDKTSNTTLYDIIHAYENYEAYDEEQYPLGLPTRARFEKTARFADSLLTELKTLDLSEASDSERISAELLAFVLQDRIDYFEFERFLNPLLSDSGFHVSWPYMVRPIATIKQARKYLKKLNALPEYTRLQLTNIREGLEKGVSQPRVIFEGYESTYEDHLVSDYTESFFYSPFTSLPESITTTQRDSILNAAKDAINQDVLPQFQRIKEFFETEYLPKTRTTLGISETPGGQEYYQNRINFYTTSTTYTADDIHNIGLNEVARIKAAMVAIIEEVGFEGSFADFLNFLRTDPQFYAETPEELLMIARDMAKRADEQLPRFFKTLPRKPYGVAPVPDAIAPKYTGGRYVGTDPESTDPGYYWVNTYDLPSRTLYTLPALTVHEAVPGHHLQGALNQELGDSIPQFRKDLYLSAYGEGWGLYTEYLAAEMGMYTTPYERFGQLTYEMWRAARLVVDTGIHAKGWSREQVVEFMAGNTALSLHEVNTETDRYISWPGQALSYKIGELKIRELRQEAEEALGPDFDIRDFHEVVLGQGTVTLDILERRVKAYVEASKNSG